MEKPSARSVALGIVALCVSAAVALNAVDSSHTRQLVAEQEQAAQAAAVPDLSPLQDTSSFPTLCWSWSTAGWPFPKIGKCFPFLWTARR